MGNRARVEGRAMTCGIKIEFDVVCEDCGDCENWINIRVGDYRDTLKKFRREMRESGWRIGNDDGKPTLCPECVAVRKREKRGLNE